MLTLPNCLTLLRIVAIPVLLILVTEENYAAACLVFLAAGVTDAVDGAVARLTDSESSLGAILDPMADKLLLVSSFLLLGLRDSIPAWLVVLVLSRDAIVVSGYFMLYFVHGEAMDVDPSRLGKVNTFFELFTIGFTLVHLSRPDLPMDLANTTLRVVTGLTTAASGVQYLYRGLLWHQRRSNVSG